MSESDFELVRGSGNIFRDLGDPDADLKQAKSIIAAQIIAVLNDRKLTVRKAAASTAFAASDFSRVRNADLGRFTLDRLIRMLHSLDDGAEVTVQIANELRRRQRRAIRDRIINMTKPKLSTDLRKRAEIAAQSAYLFYDASTAMMKFLPDSEKERYYLPFGVSWYLQRFLSLELSFKALRTLIRGEDFAEKHPLNQLFDELRGDGQKMILTCSGVERQKAIAFLRKHSTAVVDLRYFGKKVDLTASETELLVALNEASIFLLGEFGMRFVGSIDNSDQAKRVMNRLSA